MTKRFNSSSTNTAVAVNKQNDNSIPIDESVDLLVEMDTGRLMVDTAVNSAITTTAGTATSTSSLALAAGTKKFLLIQNTASTGTLYVGIGSEATSLNLAIPTGQAYEFPIIPTQAVYVLGSVPSVPYCILSA